jgi:lysozyme family protein
MNFDQAFERLLGHEGGYQRDPNDRGNWTGGKPGRGTLKGTKFGISAMSYPAEDIRNLTVERAKHIYKRDTWGPAGCDAIPVELKFDLFDTAVHSGVRQAVKFLQLSAQLPDYEVDGILGPITLQACLSVQPWRLLARFNGHRLDFLNSLKVWEYYHEGWSQRIAQNLMAA